MNNPSKGLRSLASGDSGAISRRSVIQGALAGFGMLAVGGALAGCTSDSAASDTGASPTGSSGASQRGGTLRVGAIGDTTETLNPLNQATATDIARTAQVYERLVILDKDGKMQNTLAEELIPNADGSVWTVKLKQGVTWHDGKPFTADDVIYSMRYAVTSKSISANTWNAVVLDKLKKIDATTVEVPLVNPNHLWPQTIIGIYAVMIPNGTTSFDKPVGTGPFKFVSWSPGRRSVFARNENYHVSGEPYLDGLEVVTIADASARTNALLSGEVDVISEVPLVNAETIKASSNLQLLNSPGGTAGMFAMQTDNKGPFGDVRVRQALRLLVDREQTVQNAYGGQAKVANDLFCWYDVNYASELPQRTYDPDQAKSLLSQAGYSDLKVSLQVGSNTYGGMVEMATLFAESVKAGGVSVEVHTSPSAQYYDQYYYKPEYPFFTTYWQGRTVAGMIAETQLPDSFNETNFNNAQFNQLYKEATASKDPAVQKDRLVACQEILYNEGGFIIPVFANFINAASSKVTGINNGVTANLANYDFRQTSLSA